MVGYQGDCGSMRHHKSITKKPQVMQSGLQVKMDFLVTLTDQMIQFIFNKALH